MPQLIIVARIQAKDDKIELVKNQLLKLIGTTHKEPGCVKYDLHQDNKNPAHFLFYEIWDSRELWQTHMANQHLKEYMAATEGAVDQLDLYEMTRIG
ncbi:MAG: putative quinol monooxygenase [Phycisphaerales bacterium JB043]